MDLKAAQYDCVVEKRKVGGSSPLSASIFCSWNSLFGLIKGYCWIACPFYTKCGVVSVGRAFVCISLRNLKVNYNTKKWALMKDKEEGPFIISFKYKREWRNR